MCVRSTLQTIDNATMTEIQRLNHYHTFRRKDVCEFSSSNICSSYLVAVCVFRPRSKHHLSFSASVHKCIRIVQGTHAHFAWLAAVSCLHLSSTAILHSIINDQNSPHNLQNTLCYKCVGKLGSFSPNIHLPLVNIKCHAWHSKDIQFKGCCFYAIMEGPPLKVQQYPSLSIRILHAEFYMAPNALLDLV